MTAQLRATWNSSSRAIIGEILCVCGASYHFLNLATTKNNRNSGVEKGKR
jgi:hypothetical protein